MSVTRKLLVAGSAAFVLLLAHPASAAQLEHERFHDVGTEVLDDFCGLDGVVYSFDTWVNHRANQRGADQLAFFGDSVHGIESYTNPETGQSYIHVFRFVSKDWKVTDNGDGTLTVELLGAGGDKWYSSDGDLRFLDTGTVRYGILLSDGGTPNDPSDDEFLEDLGVSHGSTGRNDLDGRDFCEDFLLATT